MQPGDDHRTQLLVERLISTPRSKHLRTPLIL